MDGETRDLSGPNASVLSQLGGDLLADETFAAMSQALEHLTVARNLVILTIDDPATARGFLRAAARQAEVAASTLWKWRDGGLRAASPTTQIP